MILSLKHTDFLFKPNKLYPLGPLINLHYVCTSLEVILMNYSGYSQELSAFIHVQTMQAHCVYLPAIQQALRNPKSLL